jgi:hypothetical protein
MSPADMAGVFETQSQKYLTHAGERSLRAAGLEKDKNYDLVYSGGFMVAVAVDSEIRRWSNNVRDSYAMVREMYGVFGTSGRRYTFDDVVSIAERMSGSPKVSALLQDCVAGQQILDTRSYLTSNLFAARARERLRLSIPFECNVLGTRSAMARATVHLSGQEGCQRVLKCALLEHKPSRERCSSRVY